MITRTRMLWVVGVLFCGFSSPSAASDDGVLGLPLACELGRTCWIPNYVDHKPGPGLLDYMCGDATYDAPPGDRHKGTDFAVRDQAAMRAGVPVLAAAAGVVVGMRDGMADAVLKNPKDPAISKKECGNGVRIKHENDLSTQYCHMRKGSVRVRAGERVTRGQQLGLVGLSGLTVFPHLHFQVEQGKDIVDPFVGIVRQKACGIGENPLWDAQTLAKLPYRPTAIFNAGFVPQKPDLASIREGRFQDTSFLPTVPVMVLWAELFRVQKGDEIILTITEPGGNKLVQQRLTIKSNKARYYAYSGKRLKKQAWASGSYRGEIVLMRKGERFSTVREIEVR